MYYSFQNELSDKEDTQFERHQFKSQYVKVNI